MSTDFLRLYEKDSDSDAAYYLSHGGIYYYISNSDKYSLKGQNFIIGASELIMSKAIGQPVLRQETVLLDKDACVKKIPSDKFYESLNQFSFIMNLSMVIARQVVLTNKIIQENRKLLTAESKSPQQVCLEYYKIISVILEEYEKRKLPWLKEILSKYHASLVFKKGEIYFKTAQPVKIESAASFSDKMIEYPKSAVIFSQGELGREMFILQRGSVEVLIGDTRVAVIDEPGSAIGEIALLLGENRSATLRAMNNVVLTKISQKDLKDISGSESPLFFEIAKSLSQKHINNIASIHSINESVISRNLGFDDEELRKKKQNDQRAEMELSSLKKVISDAFFKKDAFFLKERIGDLID
ncbi:MAG TPA: cyclic nucleotide-binding domain-containing protein [Spirochaetota bacterium]|nr:cyclic nucleotide-binding domain-containing protein [Spirochaetota bacterium]HPM33083.1 cyclic nucleotide-binding domain-containing protein [Spirochaetota bacterium]